MKPWIEFFSNRHQQDFFGLIRKQQIIRDKYPAKQSKIVSWLTKCVSVSAFFALYLLMRYSMLKTRNENKEIICRKFAFTKRRIENLPHPENKATVNQAEYSDVVCVGLKLIHSYLTGRKVFHQRYFAGRGKKSLKIGEFPAVSVENAREICNANKAMLAKGLDPVRERERKDSQFTFQEFAEKIYLPYAMARKRSWRDDKGKLEKDMYKHFGKKPLADISKADVIRYISAIHKRTSGSTANRHRALLSHMMSVAIDHELIEKNCVSRMPKFPECSGRERYLSGEEIKRFLAALDNTPQQVSGLAIKLLLASGMRKSECLSLPWSNINLDEGFAKLDMDATKGKRARTVVLNDSALTILKELQKLRVSGNPYVFPGKTGKHITTVRKTFENCKKVAGIEQFVLHGCRHTFCSILAGSGVSLFLIQRLVGHSSASMTQRYSHLGSDTLREASEIVSNQLNIAA